jgi:Family of unknown function (DUF5681)
MSNHESDGSESDGQTEVISSAKTDPSDAEVMPGPVGYRRPPKHTQFAKGISGNPSGRRKGSKNFGLVIEDELNTKIPVNENGKRKLITKREAIAKQIVHKAASGDSKAIPIILNEERAREKAGIGLGPNASQRVEDQQVMSGILERIRRGLGGSTPPDPQTTASNPPVEQTQAGDAAEPPQVSRSYEEGLPIWAINLRRP